MSENKKDLNALIYQTQHITYHLLAIIGKNKDKKEKIVEYLTKNGWQLVNIEEEFLKLKNKHRDEIKNEVDMRSKLKDWFMRLPDNIILENGDILYSDPLTKISPIEAFKYNTRGKGSVVLFLEDEKKLSNRLYYGEFGQEDYYDKEIRDINLVPIEDIADNFETEGYLIKSPEANYDTSDLPENAIGRFFNFQTVRDVIDIDSLKTTDRKKQIVSSYIFSDKIEEQVADFFEDLSKPVHKARNIIGNYGSGKSHLTAMLISIVENPDLSEYVNSEKIKKQLKDFNRTFYTVYFELQSGPVELRRWFYDKCKKQLAEKYDIHIKDFDLEKDYSDKDNIEYIVNKIKEKNSAAGLLVAIDEISDFLSMKRKEDMRQDLQFLRIIGQVAQDNDIMFIGSMQEDIFSSSRFKEAGQEIGRVRERFQNIIILKEDVEKVISERVVSKTNQQKLEIEKRLKEYGYLEKIEDINNNIDNYINLFPLTPSLIEMFSTLPFFEKRGVIQFTVSEIKRNIKREFPFFITFEKIYDILYLDPNKKNLPEVADYIKVVTVLLDKINLMESKFQDDARKIVKGLAVLSLRDSSNKGVTAKELADKLLILPPNKALSSEDHVSLVVKKLREITDGQHIKFREDKSTGYTYITLDTKLGVDPEEKIQQKADNVSEDELEHELFSQLGNLLDLIPYKNKPDVFEDECEWRKKKSFRLGYVLFKKRDNILPENLPERDYEIVFVSPFYNNEIKKQADNQLQIKISLSNPDALALLREIVAIKQLRDIGFQKTIMERKLKEKIEGYKLGDVNHIGFAFRLSKIIVNKGTFKLNNEEINILNNLGTRDAGLYQAFDEIKTSLFGPLFDAKYPLHPMYPFALSSTNIIKTLDTHLSELLKGNFNNLSIKTVNLLKSLDLIDENNYPNTSQSPLVEHILQIIKDKPDQVIKINDDIVQPLSKGEYGLEKEIVYFILSITTLLGKTILQAKGGQSITINNIKEKLGSLSTFENIPYVKLEKQLSFDFAANILNNFGLNGDEILNEKTRISAFKKYKERITEILGQKVGIQENYNKLQNSYDSYINQDDVYKEIEAINEIKWEDFDLDNISQFDKLKPYSRDMSKVKNLIKKVEETNEALKEYFALKPGIEYVHKAMNLVDNYKTLFSDIKNQNKLKELYEQITDDCSCFNTLQDRVKRNGLSGKINQFKLLYKKEIYYPAHEKYVGSKVDWISVDNILNGEVVRRLNSLVKVKFVHDTKLNQLISKLRELKGVKCANKGLLDELDSFVFCQQCFFPRNNVKYPVILSEINNIEGEFEQLLESFEKQILDYIREYRDNINFLENDREKQLINDILEKKQLPENLTSDQINVINKLFREIDVISIKPKDFTSKIFPNEEIITVEQIETNFNKYLSDIIGNKDKANVRIKLESDENEG